MPSGVTKSIPKSDANLYQGTASVKRMETIKRGIAADYTDAADQIRLVLSICAIRAIRGYFLLW